MQLGSAEHKAQFLQDTIKQYQESIWKDELNLVWLAESKVEAEKNLEIINGKLERKEYQSASVGKQLQTVAQNEINEIDSLTAQVNNKITDHWPKQIEAVRAYAKAQGIELE